MSEKWYCLICESWIEPEYAVNHNHCCICGFEMVTSQELDYELNSDSKMKEKVREILKNGLKEGDKCPFDDSCATFANKECEASTQEVEECFKIDLKLKEKVQFT